MSLQQEVQNALTGLLLPPLRDIVCQFIPTPVFITLHSSCHWKGYPAKISRWRDRWVLNTGRLYISCNGTNPNRVIEPFWITFPKCTNETTFEVIPEWSQFV
jgi:hypothetical protein